ncbi:MAG: Hsp70 family protein, partial [Sandaracinaceae bacterium]|nr:Hsp70 family protein [Sandaracinaceae bacterium]
MSQGPVLGIDLGTTNSVVAVADGGQARVLTDAEGRRLLPSVVSFHPNGETLIGYDARERRLVDAANTVYAIKRLIGRPFDSSEVKRARERFAFTIGKSKHGAAVVEVRRGKYALAEISAMVLRQLRRNAEAELGVSCERAVITVPANFNELQRSATKAAGKVAGLDVLRIINEPTAAALAYGFGKGARERIAVYDLGGGTFDMTVLELDDDVFEVLGTAGDTFLGGEDVDGEVANAMCDAFLRQHGWDPRTDPQAFERLKAAGEWAKCQLSSELATELTVQELTHGEGGRALDLHFSMTRDELEALARPYIQRTFQVCDEVMRNAGLRASEIGNVVLVGGMTRMPIIQRMVEGYFGRRPRADIDPDLVVAQGAAIHGYTIGGEVAVPRPRALGKVALTKMSREEVEARRQTRARRKTMLGVPQQPAFAPEERPASNVPPPQPARRSVAPGPLPPLPDAPTRVAEIGADQITTHVTDLDAIPTNVVDVKSIRPAPVISVSTPKTTLDGDLDRLAPEPAGPDLSSPFAAELDPFVAPQAGRKTTTLPGTQRLALDSAPPDAALDDPFANLDLPVPHPDAGGGWQSAPPPPPMPPAPP